MVVIVAGVLIAHRPCAGQCANGDRSMKLDQAARALLLKEFVSGFFLAMKYFFKPKATINYPFEMSHRGAALPRRARPAPLSQWRGALHRLQALRGDLPGPGHHHRGRPAPQRRHAPHDPLRHRHGEMHLLRPLPGGLPGRRHRRGAELRVLGRDPRGAVLRQEPSFSTTATAGSARSRRTSPRTRPTGKGRIRSGEWRTGKRRIRETLGTAAAAA